MPSKIEVADEKKLAQSGKFSSATLLLEGRTLDLSSQKKCQLKSEQNNKYDITKTSGLVHV